MSQREKGRGILNRSQLFKWMTDHPDHRASGEIISETRIHNAKGDVTHVVLIPAVKRRMTLY
jgi:hypothetical protein